MKCVESNHMLVVLLALWDVYEFTKIISRTIPVYDSFKYIRHNIKRDTEKSSGLQRDLKNEWLAIEL